MIYQDMPDEGALAQYAAALNARARRAGARGWLNAAGLRDRILESGGCCEWCGLGLLNAEFELDHVLSLKRGGSNVAANLVLSCPDCNRRKGQKHPARFAAEIYRETGRETDLIASLFERYALDMARQLMLFAEEIGEAPAPIEAGPEYDERPPYNWAD